MAEKYFNSDIFTDGKIKVTTVPNNSGTVVTYNPTTQLISTRTNEQIISDLSLDNRYFPRSKTVTNQIDLNDLTIEGVIPGYQWINQPAGFSSIGIVTVKRYSNDWITQEFVPIYVGSKRFVRNRINGTTWTSWVEVATAENYVPYTGATADLTLADKNLNFTSGSISRVENGTRIFKNVFQNYVVAAQTGILCVKFPSTAAAATMFDVTIKIYSYQAQYLGKIRVSFYRQVANAISTGGKRAIFEITDNFPTTIVNVGIDLAGNISINLGDITTSWSLYTTVEIERVTASHSGYNTDWSKNWTQTIETVAAVVPDTYQSLQAIATNIIATREYIDTFLLGSIPKTPIYLATSDLNTITTPGFYNQLADANSTLARNYPITLAGTLNVYRSITNGVIQEYTSHVGITYKRYYNGAAWASWRYLLDTVNLASSVITSNSNQTGLTGDKTTTGNWIYNGTGANSITLLRPGNTINNSIGFGFDTVSKYIGLANDTTFAFGGSPNLSAETNRFFWVDTVGYTANLRGTVGGTFLQGRDTGGYTITTTTTGTSKAEMIVRHNWSGNNRTFTLGGVSASTSGSMSQWGMFRYLNDRTINGNDGFFGWVGDTDLLQASSLAGTGTRMVIANSSGQLSTQTIPSAQNLSINPTNAGTIDISGGGTSANLQTLWPLSRPNANVRALRMEMAPYFTSAGSTNYPTSFGMGMRIERFSSASDQRGFDIFSGGTSGQIYYKTFNGSISEGTWEMFASREWSATKFLPINYADSVNSATYSGDMLAIPVGTYTSTISTSATNSPFSNPGGLISFGQLGTVSTRILGARDNSDNLWFQSGAGTGEWRQLATRDWVGTNISSNYIPLSQKGVASGVATLDTNIQIPNIQIPTVLRDKVLALGGEIADKTFTGLYDRNQLALADKEHTVDTVLTGAGTISNGVTSFNSIIFNSKSDFASISGGDSTTELTITITLSSVLSNYSRGLWQPFIQNRLPGGQMFRNVAVEIMDNTNTWFTPSAFIATDIQNSITGTAGLFLFPETGPGTASIKAVRFKLTNALTSTGSIYVSNIGLRHVSHSFAPQFPHRGDNNIFHGINTFNQSPIVPTATLPTQAVNFGQLNSFNYYKSDYLKGSNVNTISDLDSALPNGGFLSSYFSSSWGGTDRPNGASYGGYIRFAGSSSAPYNNHLDFYFNNGHGGLTSHKIWFRTKNQTSGVTNWFELYHSGNLDVSTFSNINHTHTFASLTSKPTTLSGYGITDGMSTSHVANGITSTLINNWNNSFSWGDFRTFGLGVTTALGKTDLNDNFENGFYGASGSTLNNPVSGASGSLIHQRSFAASYWSQIYMVGSSGTTPRMFLSSGQNTTRLAPWQEVWHTGHFTTTNITNWNNSFTWGDWRPYGLGSTALSNVINDFNTINTDLGLNTRVFSASSATVPNGPVGQQYASGLLITRSVNVQSMLVFGGHSGVNTLAYRNKISATDWGDWIYAWTTRHFSQTDVDKWKLGFPTNHVNTVSSSTYTGNMLTMPIGSYSAGVSTTSTNLPFGNVGGLISFGQTGVVSTRILGARDNSDNLWFQSGDGTGAWRQLASREWFTTQLNGYVTQTSLNTQLVGVYATLAGVQTFSNTNTFTQSPIIPDGTLISHAVNLGQMTDSFDQNNSAILNYVASNYISTSHVVNSITSTNISNWTSAYNFTNNFNTNFPDLVAIEALTGVDGYLRKDGNGQWSLTASPIVDATATIAGKVKLFSDTVNTTIANTVTLTGGRTYGVQVNPSGQMVVNVPWVDTNTSYTAGNGLTLTGTVFSLPITVSGSGNYITDVTQNTNGITVTKGTLPTYTLPLATSTVTGGIRLITDTLNNVAPNAVSTTASRSYAVQLNNLNQALVNIPWTDTVYVHPTTSGNKHIPAGGTTGQILRWSADGTAVWGADVDTNTTYTSSNGILLTGTNFAPTYGTTVNTIAQGNDSRIINGQTAFGWGDYRTFGLGTVNAITFVNLDNVAFTSISDINDSVSSYKPFSYGSVWTHRKSSTELTQFAVDVMNGNSYTRGINNSFGDTGWKRNWNTSDFSYFDLALWSEKFKTLKSTGDLNTVMDSGIYRQETPSSGYAYTTTLNLNSSDGRQQLTIERQGGGMKFRGSNVGLGSNSGWSDWRKVWSDIDFTQTNINNWNTAFSYGNHATAGYVSIANPQTIIGDKTFAATANVSFLGSGSNHVDVLRYNGSFAGDLVSGHVYRFGNSAWRIANQRGYNSESLGLNFSLSNDNGVSYTQKVSISADTGTISARGLMHTDYYDYDYVLTSDGGARPISDFQGSGTMVRYTEILPGNSFTPPDEKTHWNVFNHANMKLHLDTLSSVAYGLVITVYHREPTSNTEIWKNGGYVNSFGGNKSHKFIFTSMGWMWINDTNTTSFI